MEDSDLKNLIPRALEYYDEARARTEKILRENQIDRYYINVHPDEDKPQIVLINKDLKEVAVHDNLSLLGYLIDDTWVWGWSTVKYHNLVAASRTLFQYAFHQKEKNPSYLFIKSSILFSRFKVQSTMQLDVLLAIAMYLSQIPNIIEVKIKNKYNPKGTLRLFLAFR